MSESVKVALRVRPLVPAEVAQRCDTVMKYPGPQQVVIGGDRAFTYDYVFNESTDQEVVYDQTVQHNVKNFLNGYNATVIAYGQTGSGKTYTMGTASNANVEREKLGLIPRVVQEIFQFIESDTDSEYKVRVAFLEIHNEEIVDLLDERKTKKQPQIRENPDSSIRVDGCTEEEVKSANEMLGALERGSLQRATGSTMMNAHSSRSHAVFTIFLDQLRVLKDEQKEENSGQEAATVEMHSKFHFVDLAGSERLKRTGAVGARMKEGISINSGLLALGNVISALGDEKRKAAHVPFRDSKITRLLQDSLGGNSKTLMIACVSPADINFEETLNTLKYANRARNIKNKAIVNRDPHSQQIEKLRLRIRELETALASGSGLPGIESAGMDPESLEELSFLREQNSQYEKEIQRLSASLKNTRAQMSTMSDTLLDVETQRDAFRLKLQKVVENVARLPQPIDLGIDLEVDEELDIVKENLMQIRALKEKLSSKDEEIQDAREQLRLLQRHVQAGSHIADVQRTLRATSHAPAPGGARGPLAGAGRSVDDMVLLQSKRKSKVDWQAVLMEEDEKSMMPRRDSMVVVGVGDIFLTKFQLQEYAKAGEELVVEDEAAIDMKAQEYKEEAEAQINDEMKAINALAAVRVREHTDNMERLHKKSIAIDSEIAQKELLMNQLMRTRESAMEMRRHYENKIAEMEREVSAIKQEQETAPEAQDQSDLDRNAAREKKLMELRDEILKLRSKLEEAKRLQLEKSKDEHKIAVLELEIANQRKEKIRLSKRIQEEAQKHKDFMKKTEHKIRVLEKEMRSKDVEFKRMRQELQKQNQVIERRNKEKEQLKEKLQKQIEMTLATKAKVRAKLQEARGAARNAVSVRTIRDGGVIDDLKHSQRALDHAMAVSTDKLKEAFTHEINEAVEILTHKKEHQKLLQKRNEVEEKRKKAEKLITNPGKISESELEYWKEHHEALKAQIGFINSQIVQLRLQRANLVQAQEEKKESIFKRYKVDRLDQGRALILHLMQQVVDLKYKQTAVLQENEDVRVNLQQAREELKAVTRQSLLLQRTSSSKAILDEIQQVDEMMERVNEEDEIQPGLDPNFEDDQAEADMQVGDMEEEHTEEGPVNSFMKVMSEAGRGPAPKRNNYMADNSGDMEPGYEPGGDDGTGQDNKEESKEARAKKKEESVHARLAKKKVPQIPPALRNGPLPTSLSLLSKFSKVPIDTKEHRRTNSNQSKDEKPPVRRARSISVDQTNDQQDQQDDPASPSESDKGNEKKSTSVFDRLTDSSKYTGMHRVVHKQARKVVKKSNSKPDLLRPGSSLSSVQDGDDMSQSGAPSVVSAASSAVPLGQAAPAQRSGPGAFAWPLTQQALLTTIGGSQGSLFTDRSERSSFSTASTTVAHAGVAQRGRRPKPPQGGNVFSRLTDARAFTGISKVLAQERSVPKQNNEDSFSDSDDDGAGGPDQAGSRARGMTDLEREFDSLNQKWSSDKDKLTKIKKSKSTPPRNAPVGVTPVTSPEKMEASQNAVKRLDSLFSRRFRKQMDDYGDNAQEKLYGDAMAQLKGGDAEDVDDEDRPDAADVLSGLASALDNNNKVS